VYLPFLFLGIIVIVGGIIWISRLSRSDEEEEVKTADGERLVNLGLGEYNTESLAMLKGILVIIIGLILVVNGILL